MTVSAAPAMLAAVLVALLLVLLCVALRPAVPARRYRDPNTPSRPHRPLIRAARQQWSALARRRRPALRPEVVASWCDELARQVRAGGSLRGALREASSTDEAMRHSIEPMRLALERGATVAASVAVQHQEPVRGREHLGLACSVIATSAVIGGSASAPLERVAAALRLRAVDQQDRMTQAAQARMSAHVLTVVPLIMLALLIATDADVRAAVVGRAGALCVLAGVALNALGWWWMRRIIGGVR